MGQNSFFKIKNSKLLFYSTSFFNWFSLGIISPLFIIYLLSINFNPAQIGILFAVERIAAIIFDIPTGAFADKYGRKNSLLVCFSLTAFILLGWFLTTSFFILLVLSILWGFASTFQSGAEESLMIDTLNLEKDDKKRNKVFSKISIFSNFGFLCGALLATLLAFYYINLMWLASSFFYVIVFILYFFFSQEKYQKNKISTSEHKIKKILKTIKNNIIFSFKSSVVYFCFGITLIFGLVFAVYGISYPILFKEIFKMPDYYFGLIGILSAIVGIAGSFLGEKITNKKGYYYSINLFTVMLFILFFVFGLLKTFWFVLISFIMIELTKNGWFPVYQSFLNKFIPTKIRAGILSINSTISSLALAIGELLTGFLLLYIHTEKLIILSGFLFLFVPLFLFKMKRAAKFSGSW